MPATPIDRVHLKRTFNSPNIAWVERQLTAADSTGRRNTLLKTLGRCFKV